MKIYAIANELNLDRSNTGTITIPMGTWDYGEKKLEDGRTLFFRQTLNRILGTDPPEVCDFDVNFA